MTLFGVEDHKFICGKADFRVYLTHQEELPHTWPKKRYFSNKSLLF